MTASDMFISADRVYELRGKLGDSQTTFGQRFGATRRTVIRWESEGHYIKPWKVCFWNLAGSIAGCDILGSTTLRGSRREANL